ncbi:MAG: tyrosine-protein phosphatase, partial [Candidatus Obscuribacterales bacterium]|nr:tyrosine-protein phosphatase [Candidatus Obscuribacterales bacterium]
MKRLKLLPVLIFSLCLANPQAMADNNDDNSNRHHHRHNYTNGIRNLRTVHPWLFRGGAPPDQSFKTLSDMGVTTVVDLRDRTRDAAKEKELCKNFGMNFVQIPLSHRTAPTKEQINKFLKIVDTARQHTGKGSVFVHCELGDDRTGCMVAISRI